MKSPLRTTLAAVSLCVVLGASATALPTLNPAMLAAPAPVAADYGMGSYLTIAQWQAVAVPAETPMDFGLGAYPTLSSWQHASTGAAPLAQAPR